MDHPTDGERAQPISALVEQLNTELLFAASERIYSHAEVHPLRPYMGQEYPEVCLRLFTPGQAGDAPGPGGGPGVSGGLVFGTHHTGQRQ